MTRALKVAIIGCGTAGQASGLFLREQGHEVTIFERAARLAPVGAGLLLQPTGMAALKKLGAAEEILGLGSRVDRLEGRTRRGRAVLELAYGDLWDGAFGLGVHRGALFMALQRRVEAAGIIVRAGVPVGGIVEEGERRVVVGEDGARHGPFDLVVVADGSRSELARQSPLMRRAGRYEWGALWCVAPDPEGRFDGVLRQVYHGTGRMIGFLPTGRAGPGSPPTVSVFWSVRVADRERLARAGLEAWKEEVRRLTPLAEPALARIGSMDELIFASYHDTVMSRWDEGPVVYVGDAGHAMSPQLGQGANLALMDALVLGECVKEHATVGEALAAYSRRRARHLRFYQFASRWLTPVFQSGWSVAALPRDVLMGPACRWGWARRQMLESLVGVKTGIGSRLGVEG